VRAIGLLIGASWGLAILAQLTGSAGLLHHHELIEGGGPLWLAALLFLAGWQVMVAGMMLPASVPAVRAFSAFKASAGPPLPGLAGRLAPMAAMAGFLAAYFVAWSTFGLASFAGDTLVHHAVDVTPWLADHAWLIEVGVLAIAGAYQLSGLKRRGLAACRRPCACSESALATGARHARDCLVSSWALMLLMFAAGFANVAWMTILAAVMVYEGRGRRGPQLATAFGVLLLAFAAAEAWTGLTGSALLGPVV
jgi:predicted metal-binding membrane protein